jgi:hypothetical protein
MAKIIIEIEDRDNGAVMIKSTPSFDAMAKMLAGSHSESTAAHGYACHMLLQAREKSKEIDRGKGKGRILIPKSRLIQ